MEYKNKHKAIADTVFKLILFLIACFAGIGILVPFEVLSKNINI